MKQLKFLLYITILLLTGCGSNEFEESRPDDEADNRVELTSVLLGTRFSDPYLKSCILQWAAENHWSYLEEVQSLYCEKEVSSLDGLQPFTYLKEVDLVIPSLSAEDIDVLASLPLTLFDQAPEYLFNSGHQEDAIPRISKPLNSRLPTVKAGSRVTKAVIVVDHDSSNTVLDPESIWWRVDELDPSRGIEMGAKKINSHVSLHWVHGYVSDEEPFSNQLTLAEARLERIHDDGFRVEAWVSGWDVDVLLIPHEKALSEMEGVNADLLSCIQRTANDSGWVTNWDVTSINCHGEGLSDLSGIHLFPYVTDIDVAHNQITGFYILLDSLPELEILDISHNQLTRALLSDDVEIYQEGHQYLPSWKNNWNVYKENDIWWVNMSGAEPDADYALYGARFDSYAQGGYEFLVSDELHEDVNIAPDVIAGFPVFLRLYEQESDDATIPLYLVGESTYGVNCPLYIDNCYSLNASRLLVMRQSTFTEKGWFLASMDGPQQEVVRFPAGSPVWPIADEEEQIVFIKNEKNLFLLDISTPELASQGFVFVADFPDGVEGFAEYQLTGGQLWGIGAVQNGGITKQTYRLDMATKKWTRLPDLNLHPISSEVAESTDSIGGVKILIPSGSSYWVEYWDGETQQWQLQADVSLQEWHGEIALSDGYRYRCFNGSQYRRAEGVGEHFELISLPLEIYIREFDSWVSLPMSTFDSLYGGVESIEQSGQTLSIRSRRYSQTYDPAADSEHPYRAILNLDWFPDSELRRCLADQYGAEPTIAITEIRSLNCEGYGISMDQGLERLVFLEELNLSANGINFIGGYSFASVRGSDVPQGVLGLVGLRYLDLSYNNLTVIPRLEPFKHLELLDLTANEIAESRAFPDTVEVVLTGNPLALDAVNFNVEYIDNQWHLHIQDYDPRLIYSLFVSELYLEGEEDGIVWNRDNQLVFPVQYVENDHIIIPDSLLSEVNWLTVGVESVEGLSSPVVPTQKLLDTDGFWRDLGVHMLRVDDGYGGVTPYGWLSFDSSSFRIRQGSTQQDIMLPSLWGRPRHMSIWENQVYFLEENTVLNYELESQVYDYLPPIPTAGSEEQILAFENGLYYLESEAAGEFFRLWVWRNDTREWRVVHQFEASGSWQLMLSEADEGVVVGVLSLDGEFLVYSCGLSGCASDAMLEVNLPGEYAAGIDGLQLHHGSAYLLGWETIVQIDLASGAISAEQRFFESYDVSLDYAGYTGNSFIYSGDRECIEGECGVRLFEYTPEAR